MVNKFKIEWQMWAKCKHKRYFQRTSLFSSWKYKYKLKTITNWSWLVHNEFVYLFFCYFAFKFIKRMHISVLWSHLFSAVEKCQSTFNFKYLFLPFTKFWKLVTKLVKFNIKPFGLVFEYNVYFRKLHKL